MLQSHANARVDPFLFVYFCLKVRKTGRFVTVIDVIVSSGHLKAISWLILSPAGMVPPWPCHLTSKTRQPRGDCVLGMILAPHSETNFHLVVVQVVCLLYLAATLKQVVCL